MAPKDAAVEPLNTMLSDAPGYTAGQPVTTVTSPSGQTLLVLTSGYNLHNYTSGAKQGKPEPADSNEYVFVFDISQQERPQQQQVLRVPNAYAGIAFDPGGDTFYVSGGVDDNLHVYDSKSGLW
jgi:DNA-binding beta-propeller fold protein YncE